MEGYAVELAYEFYKRNPLPYPVELYNYHYLLGGPGPSCLETGPKDKELKVGVKWRLRLTVASCPTTR